MVENDCIKPFKEFSLQHVFSEKIHEDTDVSKHTYLKTYANQTYLTFLKSMKLICFILPTQNGKYPQVTNTLIFQRPKVAVSYA